MDDAGRHVDSNAGNLIAKVGSGRLAVMFVAHVDTVEDGNRAIRPVIRNGVIRSDGNTILGSDDKAGVAALLEAIREVSKEKGLPTILCVFSIREEKGVMGVKYLNVERNIPFVFDVDGSETVGRFINKTLGNFDFELNVYGREAHAARNPEKGLNAIKTAGIIVSSLNLGKDSNGGTLNIGTIFGGTSPNVIPAYSKLIGEVRGFDLSEINKRFELIKKVAEKACKATGCRYELIKKGGVPPLNAREGQSEIMDLAKRACAAAGLRFRPTTLSATIQGNALAEMGYNVLGLCKGGKFPHSKSERIRVTELEQTKRLIMEIIKEARNQDK
jgi:tripeptide aminopeptidase